MNKNQRRLHRIPLISLIILAMLLPSNVSAENSHSIDLESDGSGQWLTRADTTNGPLDLVETSFTIEYWINFETLPLADYHPTALGKYNSGSKEQYLVRHLKSGSDYVTKLVADVNGDVGCCGSGDANTESNAYSLATSTWYHFAVVYNKASGTVEYFKDGQSINTISGVGTDGIPDNTDTFYIGRYGLCDEACRLDGKIDEVRIWDDVRTGQEIADNYRRALIGTEENLVAYWKFDNDPTDSGPNGLDLTEENSPTYSTDAAYQ